MLALENIRKDSIEYWLLNISYMNLAMEWGEFKNIRNKIKEINMKQELTSDATELIKENPQLINTLARVLNSNIESAILEHGRDTLEENIIDDITGLMQDNISDIRIKY